MPNLARTLVVAISVASILGVACSPGTSSAPTLPPAPEGALRTPEDFAIIADGAERSAAMFLEASRVFTHARCTNCHPAGDVPLQGENEPHDPPAVRGPEGHGVVGMECTSCHQDQNLELARVPGAPKWALAPKEMAWVDRSPAAICAQLKDGARNGGMTLAEVAHHTGHDALVAWAWAPGAGRARPPGDQAAFAALVAAWVETGAACPKDEVTR